MGIKFFGQWLLERGVISSDQLLRAVEMQKEKNLRFGDYARVNGYLKDKDVQRLQEEQMHADMRIGELAVNLGMLTKEQVDEILTMQENDHILLGEALMRSGFISWIVLQKELDAFLGDQKEYSPGVVVVPKEARDADLVRAIVDLTQKILGRVANLESKVKPGLVLLGEPEHNFAMVYLSLSGAVEYDYILSAPREAAVAVASGLMDTEASGETDEMLIDSMMELANTACGSVTARLAKQGKKVSCSPPSMVEPQGGNYNVVRGRQALLYRLISTEGDITLILVQR